MYTIIETGLNDVKNLIKARAYSEADIIVNALYEKYYLNNKPFTPLQEDRFFNYIDIISTKLYG